MRAFVPHNLPPKRPALVLEGALSERNRSAAEALRRLDLAGEMVPSLDWFLYAFVRKEAVVSSQIEGTQASLIDLLAYEAEETPEAEIADVVEVCNYVDALTYARAELKKAKGLPLSMRLLNGAHARLLRGARGSNKQPGEIRRSQNWIGGSRPGNASFVPPPPAALKEVLTAFERYMHAPSTLPPLVRAGLLHVQFETIHPYLDGNGRIGRLLVALLLEEWGLLRTPLLYLSLHFKRHRAEYDRRLGAVRETGAWEDWLDYFLDGVETIADEGVVSARTLFARVASDRARLLGQRSASVASLRLFELLPKRPIVSVAIAMKALGVSKPTAGRAVDALVEAGILFERTGRKRDRAWAYHSYLETLREGTELER